MNANADLDRRKIVLGGVSLASASMLVSSAGSVARAQPPALALNPQRLPASPDWSRALPNGPDMRSKMTEEYAKLVARDAYFWAWPLMNIYNKRLGFKDTPEPMMVGPGPAAPLNHLAMLTDYIEPEERLVACPNQDVVYGAGSLALDLTPVVVQVPDFRERFWVYQAVDLRTDSFAQLGKMYGTTPGFYLLVGPNWRGETPPGVTKVFRSSTNTGFIGPRLFQDDTPDDKRAVQEVLPQIAMYPLADYDGRMKLIDWKSIKKVPAVASGETETKWVFPDKFFDQLSTVLTDAPPLPGEESRYGQMQALLTAIEANPALKEPLIAAVAEVENNIVTPLFQFRNYGQQLPHNWSTISNEAAFGTDYYTRTAAAKSNILVNAPNETKYYYQDFDSASGRLNGANRYTVTFAKDETPPVNGFWSLTLYNEHHFFAPNELKRYSVGTKNKTLQTAPDGSLTIYVQSEPPAEEHRSNWLPAPKGGDFSLYVRAYWPKAAVLDGSWTPPAVIKAG
jgi:hypothetical protein